MIQFDPKNQGKVDRNGTFKPIRIGRSWEDQGFRQKNPYCQYPANTPNKLKKNYDGYAWIRIPVNIPESWRGKEIHLIGGPIDDADRTWFNGTSIGETPLDKFPDSYRRQRNYTIPQEAIRFSRENEILIQVYDRWGDGGITGPLNIVCGKQSIGNEWSPYVRKLNFYDVDAFHNW